MPPQKPKHKPNYEFCGPPGAALQVLLLAPLLYLMYFTCNDVSGCPAPALLSPRSLTWSALKAQIPWPVDGFAGFASWEVSGWVAVYYLVNLLLGWGLPGNVVEGGVLGGVGGGGGEGDKGVRLRYRFNAFTTTLVQLAFCAIGTAIYGANFPLWTYISTHYLQILTANVLLAYAVSLFVYIRSFAIDPNNPRPSLRRLALGGVTGSPIYDFYIGRELNPRITLPLIGEIDIKTWLEMRPGLTGWVLLNCASIAKQYRLHGYVSDSMLAVACVQAYYVLEGQYAEEGVVGMMDVTTDGLGFMLTFGDIVWVPFLYSTQCRYLAVYPVRLGWLGLLGVAAVFATGLYIFRAANGQKYRFRTQPDHPSVKGLKYLQTKRGTKLLIEGWWGAARHVNYFGDWLQSLPFCLPTGLAGYVILPAGSYVAAAAAAGGATMLDGRMVVQDEAVRGWGAGYTYLYAVYFATLLIHREGRDDAACQEKYGEDWERYKKIVRWRILPRIY
ncbi:erg24, C-14 sterol reductase [Onygenales sp. PD_10]|nr:erg24, C-14 sterol reductase [Onygenales sp. PD_10]